MNFVCQPLLKLFDAEGVSAKLFSHTGDLTSLIYVGPNYVAIIDARFTLYY